MAQKNFLVRTKFLNYHFINFKTMRKKEYIDTNVYEETLKRINYLYDLYDELIVSFSGGKDSTALLNCVLTVAEKRNKLPVKAWFIDEEVIHPPTIEYVARVRQDPRVKMMWYCLEFKHRNACSEKEPFWFTWDKDKKDLWTRDLPDDVISYHPQFKKGMSFQEWFDLVNTKSNTCVLTGIRTEESLRRYRTIASKKNDSYISKGEGGCIKAHPIYDWTSQDVWRLIDKFGYDYNRTYDIFNKTSLYNKFLQQRVCPPFGEEPLNGIWVYAECFPEMWHKMLSRVSGVATAWRYSQSELWQNKEDSKPQHLTWKQYLDILLDRWDEPYKSQVVEVIMAAQREHFGKTEQEIPDDSFHSLSGCSWRFLCKIAVRGDFKGRTFRSMMTGKKPDNSKKKSK